MASQRRSFENPGDPVRPNLWSVGRSVADRLVIRDLILKLVCYETPTEIAALINQNSVDVPKKVGEAVELELGFANSHRAITFDTYDDYKKRIEYLVGELKLMQEAIREEGDESVLLFDEPVQENR